MDLHLSRIVTLLDTRYDEHGYLTISIKSVSCTTNRHIHSVNYGVFSPFSPGMSMLYNSTAWGNLPHAPQAAKGANMDGEVDR